MKLATLKSSERDGKLIVVSRDNQRFIEAVGIASNLQFALDHWQSCQPKLEELYKTLNNNAQAGKAVEWEKLHSPLPRAYEWIDGSAFINHILLVRKARNAEPPKTLTTDPLIYQGGSGTFLAPTEAIPLGREEWGCDFESEVCVVLGDTPQAVTAGDAEKYIRLVMLVNDVSLRNLIPEELEKGFGFFISKPSSAFSPIAVTLDELSPHWQNARLHLPLSTKLNGAFFGDPDAGKEMHFSFADLIAHITRTRSYTAGTILGSGTVSNADTSRGSSCLAEKRMLEKINTGNIQTSFLRYGDEVEIEMLKPNGESIFGKIRQRVVRLNP